ncbi:hypothetical protein LSH36_13g00006 [Paralvinella palmiformis]|uniref:C-type lectin domain-containing protein n=1 Tax=Paralvinella palmiformis TaxID=53620 RepID=A0AAD9NFZ4_9ANNE|nr:hypothetical protein LSH36_13g00006 [Paralvinella palmiformis]
MCRQIYDFAGTTHSTIMAVRNRNDTAFLNSNASKKNVWLGIYGRPHARKNDFLYQVNNEPVTWSYWGSRRPTLIPNYTYVIAYDRKGNGHKWLNRCDDVPVCYFCELF